jgi:hypothetical protein
MFSRSNFLFSFYLHLRLLSYLFPSCLLNKILCEFSIPPHVGTHWNGSCLLLLPVSAVLWDVQQSNRSVGEALDPSERLWLKIQIRPHQTMLSLQLPKPANNRFSTKESIKIQHHSVYSNCKCNCNLFAVHKSQSGHSPVDIDIVTYIPSNIMYIESKWSKL